MLCCGRYLAYGDTHTYIEIKITRINFDWSNFKCQQINPSLCSYLSHAQTKAGHSSPESNINQLYQCMKERDQDVYPYIQLGVPRCIASKK